jgi:hypothetical protein
MSKWLTQNVKVPRYLVLLGGASVLLDTVNFILERFV